VRHPLGQAARVHEDERRAVRAHVGGDPVQNLGPLLPGRHGFELALRELDREVELPAVAEVDDPARRRAIGGAARLARADEQAGDGLDRALRGRQPDALGPVLRQRLEALQGEREVRSALVARHRMDLVDDHRAHVAEALAALGGRHQEVQRFGRRDQEVGRLAKHRSPGARRGVARAGNHAQVRDDQPHLPRTFADLRSGRSRFSRMSAARALSGDT
jgi:hypothetical protein